MSYLEEHIPFCTTLEPGVREAVSRCAPHLKHVDVGTVVGDGKKKLIWVKENTTIERATLISINDEVIVKYGLHVTFGQVNAMRLVRERTSLPVPKVLGTHEDDNGYKYVVMEYLKGCDLASVWHSLTTQQKESFAKQLKPMYDELHSVKGTYIGGVGNVHPEGHMFKGVKEKRPYQSEVEMNEAIVRADRRSWRRYGGSPPEAFINCTLPWLPKNHEIVLSHGQPYLTHFLVDMEREVVTGVVGWNDGGFFPEYWDCVCALYGTYWKHDWIQYIHEFLKPYYDEYALFYWMYVEGTM